VVSRRGRGRRCGEGRRTLDHLDVHYYPEGVFNDDTSPATRAHRLRSTRSLWDPAYTDESWIGTDQWASTQPQPNEVMLVPRMRDLVDAHYPGTGLAITEWNWGALDDLLGGLAVATCSGSSDAKAWTSRRCGRRPAKGSPASAAFLLYRQADRPFADGSLATTVSDADLLGVYAGATMRHDDRRREQGPAERCRRVRTARGNGDDAALRRRARMAPWWTTPMSELSDTVIVPAYAAVFLSIAGTGDTGGSDAGSGDDGGWRRGGRRRRRRG
jgi:hypothetical protein